MEETIVCVKAAGENCKENQSEAALPLDQHVNDGDVRNVKDAKNTSTNDSESIVELKNNDSENILEENDKTEKHGDNFNPLIPTKGNNKDEFLNKRVAKQFRVLSSNKSHQGEKVNKVFFGTVENLVSGKESWRILYDDGDVDIFSRGSVFNAIRYYEMYKGYDTMLSKSEVDEKSRNNSTSKSSSNNSDSRNRKTSPPKRGKKSRAKVGRKEPVAEWTGPPDEQIDGGWPEGWVKKVFVRNSGATKGTKDRYWYSPKQKYKLRSMVQVKRFLKALAENKGDEIEAKKNLGRL